MTRRMPVWVSAAVMGALALGCGYSEEEMQAKQARIDELTQQRNEIQEMAAQVEKLQSKLSEADWISYKDRWRNFGEEAAVRWVIGKYGEK